MEFLKANLLNTTTQLDVNSNSNTSSNLFNRDSFVSYFSDGLADDSLTSTVVVTFDSTIPVSRIALMNTNVKDFTIFYNGLTANTFNILGAATATSSYTSNSDTSLYFKFSTISVSSITIDMKKTITANQEKVLGLFLISDNYLSLDQIPNSSGYKPKLTPKQITHTLADGGTRINTVRTKWNLNISLDYIQESMRDSLRDIYDLQVPFNFVAFETSTSWDALLFEAVWPGTFDFYEFSDDAVSSGFSGRIKLLETPS